MITVIGKLKALWEGEEAECKSFDALVVGDTVPLESFNKETEDVVADQLVKVVDCVAVVVLVEPVSWETVTKFIVFRETGVGAPVTSPPKLVGIGVVMDD